MRHRHRCAWMLCCLLYWAGTAAADSAVEVRDFADESLRQRFQELSAELRCPKCSNQSLYESDAMIAVDLRRELHRLLHEGLEDEAILDYMTGRYGEFIRYRPRFSRDTAPLWLAPLLLAAAGLGGFALWRRQAGRRAAPPASASAPAPAEGGGLRGLLLAVLCAALALYGARAWQHWQDWRLGQEFRAPGPAAAASLARLEARHLRQPHRREYALLLGREYLLAGRYREARTLLEEVLQRTPEDAALRALAELAGRLQAAAERRAPSGAADEPGAP